MTQEERSELRAVRAALDAYDSADSKWSDLSPLELRLRAIADARAALARLALAAFSEVGSGSED